MNKLILDTLELRSTLPPFFHIGITAGKNNQIMFDESSLVALKEYIEPLVKKLKWKEQDIHIKISNLSEVVVAKFVENLESEGKKWRAVRLQQGFKRLIGWTLKNKERKHVKEAVKKELSHFSYILPIEYLDTSIDRQIFPIDFILWSSSTVDSIIESLRWKVSIIPALSKNKGK